MPSDLERQKYEFSYYPCTERKIDIESMRVKTDVFNDHVYPRNEPAELDAHENPDGSVDIYPKKQKPYFIILEEGRFSHEARKTYARDRRRLGYLEIYVNGYTFRVHQKSYRDSKSPKEKKKRSK